MQLAIEPLSKDAFAPYGDVLGLPPGSDAFSSPLTDFWHAHQFEAGEGGETEVLWVNYRNSHLHLSTLEAHWFTQQAIVPLGGADLVHVVCTSQPGSAQLPRLQDLRAFRVRSGSGICMRPGCWHASFVFAGEVSCLMLTRRSTTRDLIGHLSQGTELKESSLVSLASLGAPDITLLA